MNTISVHICTYFKQITFVLVSLIIQIILIIDRMRKYVKNFEFSLMNKIFKFYIKYVDNCINTISVYICMYFIDDNMKYNTKCEFRTNVICLKYP